MPIGSIFSTKTQTRRIAVATDGLIILNSLIFIGSRADPSHVFSQFGLVPADLSLYTMFTAMFIHSDVLHLAMNMIFLWFFGQMVEFAMGGVEYLLFYVASGFTAAIVHIAIVATFALDPTVPVVGASGAIAGVLGVYAIRFYRSKLRIGKLELPASVFLLAWLLLQAALGVISLYMTSYNVLTVQINFRTVGYWSHIGGFAFGMLVAQLTRMDIQGHKDYLLAYARSRVEHGALLDVVRSYEELLRLDPNDPVAYADFGRIWAMLKDREQSLISYRKAIELFLRAGMRDDARLCFQEMSGLWPDAKLDPSSQYRLACLLEEDGRYADAAEAFMQVAVESAGSPEAQEALLKAGHIQLVRLHDSPKASRTLQRLLDDYPQTGWRSFAEGLLRRLPSCS